MVKSTKLLSNTLFIILLTTSLSACWFDKGWHDGIQSAVNEQLQQQSDFAICNQSGEMVEVEIATQQSVYKRQLFPGKQYSQMPWPCCTIGPATTNSKVIVSYLESEQIINLSKELIYQYWPPERIELARSASSQHVTFEPSLPRCKIIIRPISGAIP